MGCHCLSSREDKKVGRRGIKSAIPSYGNLNEEGEESATYLHWFYKVIPWERSLPLFLLVDSPDWTGDHPADQLEIPRWSMKKSQKLLTCRYY